MLIKDGRLTVETWNGNSSIHLNSMSTLIDTCIFLYFPCFFFLFSFYFFLFFFIIVVMFFFVVGNADVYSSGIVYPEWEGFPGSSLGGL